MRSPLLFVIAPLVALGCGGPAAPAQTPSTDGEEASAAPAAQEATGEVAESGSGGPAPADAPEPAGRASADKPSKCASKKAPEGETDSQRKRRLKKEKIAECQTVAEAIQKAQLQDTIASINDKAQLTKVSGQLATAASELDQLDVCVEGLKKLRDEYSGRARTMSGLLAKATKTTEIDEQKAAVAEFRKLHPLQTAFVNKINEFCNAPVE
ncbi:MAG: hypothetical protein JRI23_28375 [Deltaproteobacteria bacterium]|jgi:hypothetical protein|nr:hypothetical protein [Deltaproteobacteria bacterium]MBW2536013.1 hypothetical protein [Deltaproteobacteria bacterium]